MSSRARTRDVMWRKACRKRRLAHALEPEWDTYHPYYNNLHQYSKNKIHCSCPMCSPKTKKNRHKTYHDHASWRYHRRGPYNYSMRDARQMADMDSQEQEYSF